MPPTTPPAIAPVFELLLEDDGEDVLDVMMDWLLLVELGTTEALPVTSGESPASCAVVAFQEPDVDESMYAQCGTRVPSGMGSGKVPAVALTVQLADQLA